MILTDDNEVGLSKELLASKKDLSLIYESGVKMINITFKAEKRDTKKQFGRALGSMSKPAEMDDYDWNICPQQNKTGARFTLSQIWCHCIRNIATLSIDDEILEMPGMYSKEMDVLPTCIFLNEGNLDTLTVLHSIAKTIVPFVRPSIIPIAGSGGLV